MKKSLLVLLFAVATLAGYAQVAINTDGTAASASAMLDVKSDTAGILIPRMTAVQRDAINNPAQGLMVFVTDDSTFYYYKKTSWLQFSSGENGWTVNGDTVYNAFDQVVIGTNTPQADANLTVYKSTMSSYLSTNLFSDLSNGGSGAGYVTYNRIVNSGSGLGACVFNEVSGTGTNPTNGVYNYFKVNVSGSGDLIGSHTAIFSHGSGSHIGTYNGLYESGNGNQYGCSNVIDNSGSGNHYGTYNSLISGSGSGKHYGTYNYLSNYNSGNKYGSYNYIELSAGGKHYGIYSRAEGNVNYAGYFLGRMYISDSVGIGVDSATALLDVNGAFRLRDGSESDGYILKSDANGNAGWIDGATITNTLDKAYDQGGAGAGKNITADNGAVHVNGTDGFLVTGTSGSGNTIDDEITGAGTRMFFNPNKAAFRAGYIDNNQWDNDSIGSNSVAMGFNTKAISMRSTAFGNTTRAAGPSSTAMGSQTVAKGNGATAMGVYSIAAGRGSTALGWGTHAYSFDETALGSYNTVYTPANTESWDSDDRLFVVGNGSSETSKHNALTIYKNGRMNINDEYFMPQNDGTAGQIMQTNGSGQVSFVDAGTIGNTLDNAYDQGGTGAGKNIIADAGAVRVNGTDGLLVTGTVGSGNTIDTEITGAGTRMFFNPRKAAFRAGKVDGNHWNDANIGGYSVAMGFNTTAQGAYSMALGYNTTASGTNSTAMGVGTTASGSVSTVLGSGTTAPSYKETTIGSHNTDYTPVSAISWDASDRLFVIGNGMNVSSKSDALIVYKNGNAQFNNKITAPASGTDADMKAYIYGYLNGASGSVSIDASKSSSGFTVARVVAGKYRVTFTESSISNYILTANAIASANPRFVTYIINAGSNNFDIYVWKLDGTLMDSDVSFVVYKK